MCFCTVKQHCVRVSTLKPSKCLPIDLSNLCQGQNRHWHLWGHRTCAGGPLWAQSCSLTLQLQPGWQLAIARNRETELSHLHSHLLYFWPTVISSRYRHTQLPNQQNKLYYILRILRKHVCLPSRRGKSKYITNIQKTHGSTKLKLACITPFKGMPPCEGKTHVRVNLPHKYLLHSYLWSYFPENVFLKWGGNSHNYSYLSWRKPCYKHA